ncbi:MULTISPECIES: DUF4148 domain-containing protein [Bordetella]|uniref:Exported protein n=2 Tax=Bordetella TaxID=517 RepID=K0M9S7_BORPB|nr:MULTISPECIES: DUF4148 domain-containing protein [Bordetella]KAK68602.1 PF13663 domain protein [Bordetella bronchiseptica 980-2]AMG86714.2 hypothetical protein AL472_01965 [Bordetella bronchiseptica]AWP77830.1 hypothetical protein B7P04_00520 [Bordetella bronchiseptica]AWP82650.1 hypothetical protein B7P00_00520 [Bordetella bronchiseptica]AWQ08218.1 hypothetical protein B9G72_00520 [Bordetella bronchiseptica]
MKTLATAVMLSMTMAAGAQAADLGAEPTRAQVQAELVQAKANGQYTFGEQDYPAAITQGSALSAAEVRDDLAQAKAAGEVTFGNLDYPPQASNVNSSMTRAQVQADLAQAKNDGVVTFGNLDYPPQHG